MLLAALDRAFRELPPAARVLVACSGGRDSVVLGYATVDRLGADRVVFGHVDHGVRADSNADADFVSRFGASLGARVLTRRIETRPDEASMRTARYAALEAMRLEAEAMWVLVAQSEDDQAETVMLSLLRTGRLTPMPAARGAIRRPLLAVPRAEIARFAVARRLEFREDPSNLSPAYLRNRVRKELFPLIESRYRPGFVQRLARAEGPGYAITLSRVDGGALEESETVACFDAERFPELSIVAASDAMSPSDSAIFHGLGVAEGERLLWVPGAFRAADSRLDAAGRALWKARLVTLPRPLSRETPPLAGRD